MERHDEICGCCGKAMSSIIDLPADQSLCDDCFIENLAKHKSHKTYYENDTLGYMRRLKENETIHPQKFH